MLMTKKDILELFKFLKTVYPMFEVNQYKIDTWTELLEDQSSDSVMSRAKAHAKAEKFPPSVADLREQHSGRYIPSAEETDLYDMTAGED